MVLNLVKRVRQGNLGFFRSPNKQAEVFAWVCVFLGVTSLGQVYRGSKELFVLRKQAVA